MDTKNKKINEYNITPNIKLVNVCVSIMNNIIKYLSDDVYVEVIDNFYNINSYKSASNERKEFTIKINKSEFEFWLNNPHNGTVYFAVSGINNKSKDVLTDSGNFKIKINNDIFKKFEFWLIEKSNEFLYKKAKSLENSLYKEFNIDKRLKRKYINNIINEKKEDL